MTHKTNIGHLSYVFESLSLHKLNNRTLLHRRQHSEKPQATGRGSRNPAARRFLFSYVSETPNNSTAALPPLSRYYQLEMQKLTSSKRAVEVVVILFETTASPTNRVSGKSGTSIEPPGPVSGVIQVAP